MKTNYLPSLCAIEQIAKYIAHAATAIKLKDLPENDKSRTSCYKLLVFPGR